MILVRADTTGGSSASTDAPGGCHWRLVRQCRITTGIVAANGAFSVDAAAFPFAAKGIESIRRR
jgi:hypothetical protein